MGKVVPIITNLTAGETTPLLDARVDFNKLKNACEELVNFIVRPQGPGTKRSGTIYAGEVENHNARARLIPFKFSTVQAYALEFGEDASGNGYMRPWKRGEDGIYGVIVSNASPVKIGTPYLEIDLPELQYTQTADILYSYHSRHAPQKLTRLSHTQWNMADEVFGPSITPPLGAAVTAKGTTGSTSYSYQLTAKDMDGNESLPTATITVANGNASLSTTNYNECVWSNAGADAVEVCCYRGYDGIFKYIGSADPDGEVFKDTGQDYDATLTPPEDYQPFDSAGNYPRCGAFFGGRKWMGGTDNRPQTVWGSKVGEPQNLSRSRPSRDNDMAQFTIDDSEVNAIVWMTRGKKVFLMGTTGSEWILKSSDGGAITPTSIDADKETFNGCSTMRALAIGSVVLFVEQFGKRVLEFAYTLESDGYNSPDMMVLAEHLTRDNVLQEWAYAQTPHRLVFTVRDDGISPVLTYFRDHEVVGWWRFITDGAVESVCTIPGEDRDEIWLIVRREIDGVTKRYVEVLAPTFSNDDTCEDAFFVDCGATVSAWNPADTEATAKRLRMQPVSNATWSKGDEVFIFSSNAGSGAAFNINFASNVGRQYAFRNADTTLSRAKVTATTSNAGKVLASLQTSVPAELRDVAVAEFARMFTGLVGLDWLEGKTVDMLGDGKLLTPQVVTGGAVPLLQACAKVHVGLHYEASMVPHAMEAGFQDGTAMGRAARISKVGIRLYQTYGLKAGPKNGDLSTINFCDGTERMGAALVPFSGDKEITLDSGTEASPQIRFVHDVPLPCTILSIMPRIHGTGG
ncbi:MAG: hypothetical protein RDU24_08800 [Humidesulfovibrio sp.]|uniref:hypothetical protein n=1 Tax=Humidesulfovibrio sp. TaxID=2910988 RepID=UPI0027F04BD9|nr:hypothetical protein [Humidesulfovibrio sp.]MDQ7835466.1 hypothetical protein [Humidesulfovibrio sp.]